MNVKTDKQLHIFNVNIAEIVRKEIWNKENISMIFIMANIYVILQKY